MSQTCAYRFLEVVPAGVLVEVVAGVHGGVHVACELIGVGAALGGPADLLNKSLNSIYTFLSAIVTWQKINKSGCRLMQFA